MGWINLFTREKDKKGNYKSQGKVAMEFQIMHQSVADLRPVGKERESPNRDPFLPPPDRIRWSLLHPFDMLEDILGPDLCRKIKFIGCLLCCIAVGGACIVFVGPLFSGN